jgi:hypothetical protein
MSAGLEKPASSPTNCATLRKLAPARPLQLRVVMRAAVLVAVLAFATLARAQPPGLTPPSGAQPAPQLQATPLRKKERGTAAVLSLGGTVVPFLIMMSIGNSSEPEYPVLAFGATAILLPSAGHWYAGKILTTGMGIRAVSGVVATVSIGILAQSDGDASGPAVGALVGLGGLAIGAIYDLATAGSAVDEWNRKHATVMPTALVLRDGYGVGLAGTF